MIFAHPPLVEIIAELHWLPWPGAASATATPGQPIQFPLPTPELEETYSRFSSNVAAIGFGVSERLSPMGFPVLPFTPLLRYRKSPGSEGNFLYQIGPGLFSANALPPYRDWESFRPILKDGVQALLSSLSPSQTSEFTKIVLRYVDLFSSEFTEDIVSFKFLNEILGIELALPSVLSKQVSDANKIQSGLLLTLPLSTGLTMRFTVGDGSAAGKSGIIMSTEVTAEKPTSPYMQQIMEVFETAHDSIRQTFLGLTEKLRAKLQPIE
jgi:uncharacterized protein (TIGR04255 family)